ncbi:hypothetical protein [Luteimonas abyssi]|uniref:hypothetical protein n=1 Tax=Luteimonas abyssi TaxID=1247514 RepID=UPI0012F8F48F|nr:hypothetical protein [Luteimonas abyssi]
MEESSGGRPPNRSLSVWASRLTSVMALLIALGTLAGICLHLTGHIAHITQLRGLGVPSDLFGRGVEWTMINGYYAIYYESARLLDNMPLTLLGVICLMIALVIWFFRLPAPKRARSQWVEKIPAWLKNAASAILLSALSMTLAFYLFLLILLIAIIPALVGESAGKQSADKMIDSFRTGEHYLDPAELWRENELMIRGYIVATSTDHVAIFDTESERLRVVEFQNFEVRTQPLSFPRNQASNKADNN